MQFEYFCRLSVSCLEEKGRGGLDFTRNLVVRTIFSHANVHKIKKLFAARESAGKIIDYCRSLDKASALADIAESLQICINSGYNFVIGA